MYEKYTRIVVLILFLSAFLLLASEILGINNPIDWTSEILSETDDINLFSLPSGKRIKALIQIGLPYQLEDEIVYTGDRLEEITDIAVKIREKEVHIAKNKSSIEQLEKFNANLVKEMNELAEEGGITKKDRDKLKELKSDLKGIDVERSKLLEEQVYSETTK